MVDVTNHTRKMARAVPEFHGVWVTREHRDHQGPGYDSSAIQPRTPEGSVKSGYVSCAAKTFKIYFSKRFMQP